MFGDLADDRPGRETRASGGEAGRDGGEVDSAFLGQRPEAEQLGTRNGRAFGGRSQLSLNDSFQARSEEKDGTPARVPPNTTTHISAATAQSAR